ncbi:MAG: nickel pincer cofactor biosynthesis protein LarB [Caldilineaceae bacterium SB0664_bin_27]|uniref:Nickel pincer cofactor biosynthesis protein LarB n=1 Tax=Caldilineaceae bacterium SB0664_bin_27 TaxID=2605260 RepID=A0A6B0Z215_9CHLR|nr:nickel pincer cofactor biosynthesis protein LarB [Caldilineaceae bacterium SB0664_bin_27]
MNETQLAALLTEVAGGTLSVDDALTRLRSLPFEALEDVATLDHHRSLRTGFPEVIYCEGKTEDQVAQITEKLAARSPRLLGTRATEAQFRAASQRVPDLEWNELAHCIWMDREPGKDLKTGAAVVCAGTSDLPVLEEASLTLRLMGHEPRRITDVGVAGLHRLIPHIPVLQEANVVVVIAGMEGALASVVAGLTQAPVIAVPTSVGYGASFGGIAALLAMLNGCASGMAVVNIDNGYGAAHMAALINEKIEKYAPASSNGYTPTAYDAQSAAGSQPGLR